MAPKVTKKKELHVLGKDTDDTDQVGADPDSFSVFLTSLLIGCRIEAREASTMQTRRKPIRIASPCYSCLSWSVTGFTEASATGYDY